MARAVDKDGGGALPLLPIVFQLRGSTEWLSCEGLAQGCCYQSVTQISWLETQIKDDSKPQKFHGAVSQQSHMD